MPHFTGKSKVMKSGSVSGLTVFISTVLLLYILLSNRLAKEGASAHAVLSYAAIHRAERTAPRAAEVVAKPRHACLRSVFYDKPVKTGSTSISTAIRRYLWSTGRVDLQCGVDGDSCLLQATRVCKGLHRLQREAPSFLGHFRQTNGSVIDCLKGMGYYAVTSIRHPYERRKSAYLYNKSVRGNHYSIPYNVSFEEFMERLPKCVLFQYYDGLGAKCDVGIDIAERIGRIVERYDEVIELGSSVGGRLFGKIRKFIERQNQSRYREESYKEFDEESFEEEMMLYKALRNKMLRSDGINASSERVPC